MNHTCHWPDCPREVPPRLWGCLSHWERLPRFLRDAVWQWYVPGQEITKTPSVQYVQVARVVQAWIRLCGEGYPLTRVGLEAIREREAIDNDFKAQLPRAA